MFDEETRNKALERLAEFAEAQGFSFRKFESLGDTIFMQAGTRWEHDDIVQDIREQIPRHRHCKVSNVDLLLNSDPGEPIPDLVVVREPLAPGGKPWAHETELLVEVVSKSNYREDHIGKRVRYALSGAPQYLLIDPRDGLCLLHTGPVKKRRTYREILTTKFGEPIIGVHCMDSAPIDTSGFLRYT
jgi:Uma2 family endonuclease